MKPMLKLVQQRWWEIAAFVGIAGFWLSWHFVWIPTVLRYGWVLPLLWPAGSLRVRAGLFVLVCGMLGYAAYAESTVDRFVDLILALAAFLMSWQLGKRVVSGDRAMRKLTRLMSDTPGWTEQLPELSIEKVSRDAILQRQQQLENQLNEVLFGLLNSLREILGAHSTALLWTTDDGAYGIREVCSISDHFNYDFSARSGEGVVGWVIANQRQWTSSELGDTIKSPMYVRDEGIHSVVVQPIMHGSRLVGALYADSTAVQRFGGEEVSLLQVFVRLILDHIQFNQEVHMYDLEKTRVEAFFAAAGSLLEPGSLQALSSKIFETAQAIVPVDGMVLALRHKDAYVIRANKGSSMSRLLGTTVEHDSLVDWVLRSLQGIHATNLDSVVRPLFGHGHKVDIHGSAMVVPLQRGPDVNGALVLVSSEQDRFSPHEIMIFENLKKIISVAVHQRQTYSNVKSLASTDQLTQLMNRRFFLEKFDKEMRRLERSSGAGAFAMLDVDHFKSVNDTHGHSVGDDVLTAVGEVLRSSVREHDISGRFGGEEFVLFCPDIDPKGATKLCERIRKRISELKFQGAEGTFSITASIGIAMFPDHARDRDTLVQIADACLYKAKNNGRNRVILSTTSADTDIGTMSGSLG